MFRSPNVLQSHPHSTLLITSGSPSEVRNVVRETTRLREALWPAQGFRGGSKKKRHFTLSNQTFPLFFKGIQLPVTHGHLDRAWGHS